MVIKNAPNAQLRLTPLAARTVEIPPDIERRLIEALAELLILVATRDGKPTPGGSDE
jgi:hypothetical protein